MAGIERIRELESFLDLNPMGLHLGAEIAPTVDLYTLVGMVVLCHALPEVLARDVATIRTLEATGALCELEAGDRSPPRGPPPILAVRRRKIGFAAAATQAGNDTPASAARPGRAG